MSVNSSSNSSLHPSLVLCNRTSISIFTALFISYILLLLPVFLLVFSIGYKQWRKQRSVTTAAKMSHLDIITLNLVVMELISFSGSCLYCCGIYTNHISLMSLGLYVFSIISPGENAFHLLTCVERYLAVVHPVTYVRLRQGGGVRIRNISIVCVWLFSFGLMSLSHLSVSVNSIFLVCLLAFCFFGVSFCSISVLCVLIRPGPGEVGGNKERVDRSKLRAFHTIMAIMVTLLLRFISSLVINVTFFSSQLSYTDICFISWSAAWFSLPSSLVLPLMFLRRAGKLPGCKHNTEPG